MLVVATSAQAKKPKKGKKPASAEPQTELVIVQPELIQVPCPSDGDVVRYHSDQVTTKPGAPAMTMSSTATLSVTAAGDSVVEVQAKMGEATVEGLQDDLMGDLVRALAGYADQLPAAVVQVTFGELANEVLVTNLEAQRAAMGPMMDEAVALISARQSTESAGVLQSMWPQLREASMSDAALSKSTLELVQPTMEFRCGLYEVGQAVEPVEVPSPLSPGTTLPGVLTQTIEQVSDQSARITVMTAMADVDLWDLMGPMLAGMGVDRSLIPEGVPPLQISDTRVIDIDLATGWPRGWTKTAVVQVMGVGATETSTVKRVD
jgi:hypothetical protein